MDYVELKLLYDALKTNLLDVYRRIQQLATEKIRNWVISAGGDLFSK